MSLNLFFLNESLAKAALLRVVDLGADVFFGRLPDDEPRPTLPDVRSLFGGP